MKKIVSIVLIFAFFVQCTSQYWVRAVFETNREYIAANICINRFESIPVCKGSCVLEKQLNETEKQRQQLPELKIKEINLLCQNQPFLLPAEIFETISESSFPLINTSLISSNYLLSVFRPPAVSV